MTCDNKGRMFARTTDEGTAASETALCADHNDSTNRGTFGSAADTDVTGPWVDATGNDALACRVCGSVDVGWGQSYRSRFRTPEGLEVVLYRKAQRCRWFDPLTGEQVGPEHANVVPALIAAWAVGWYDTTAPDWLNEGAIAEVRTNSHPRKRVAASLVRP